MLFDMKIYFLMSIFLLTGGSGSLTAQTVSGKVVDTEQQPVDGATIILQTSDSVFVDATISSADGNFVFNHQPEAYRLIFQHLLYHTLEKKGKGKDAGITVMQAKDYALDEVVVQGERPLVKVEGSRLTYDMPQLTANKLVTSVYDALKQLPGVMEQNGVLTLAGAGSVSIILNGKPTSMTYEQLITLLKGMPASRAEQAEVMYNTPPQYHVRGAAINVILKGYKPGEGGLQGEVKGSYVQADKAGGEGGVTLAYLSPKIDIDFMYNLNDNYNRQGHKLVTRHTLNHKIHNISQTTNGESRDLIHTLRLGSNYKFDEHNQLELSYTSSLHPDKQQSVTSLDNTSTTFNHAPAEGQMHNVALNYTSGFGLTGGIDYTYFRNKEKQSFQSKETNGQETAFLSNATQSINRWKVYADQSHTLPNEWVLNYGTSFAYVNNRNSQVYDLAEMSGMNTKNQIDEYTYNLYAGFEKSFGNHWNLSAAVTMEYYQMMSYKKWAVYPNLNLSYVLSASHIFQFEFSSDKTYPDYWTLSGSTGYLNNYQETAGNTSLKPYTDYSAALTYILKSKYIFQLSYDYIKDYFMQMIYLDSSRLKAVYNYQNWDYSQIFAFTSVIPFKKGERWDSQLMLCLSSLHHRASNYYDAPFDRKIWNIAGSWTNTLILSKRPNIKMEISATGTSKSIQGSYTIQPAAFIHAALRYTFAEDKAMIQIKGNDLFNGSNHLKTKVRNGDQILDMDIANYMRNFTVSFSYKFGGYKKKEVKDVDISRFKH